MVGNSAVLNKFEQESHYVNGVSISGYFTKEYTIEQMEQVNYNSIYCDGVENVEDGRLVYTDELMEKVENIFGVRLPKEVLLEKAPETANLLVNKIIFPFLR